MQCGVVQCSVVLSSQCVTVYACVYAHVRMCVQLFKCMHMRTRMRV